MAKQKNNTNSVKPKSIQKLSPRNQVKLSKLTAQTNQAKQTQTKKSKKTQGMVNKLKQANIRKMHKQHATGQMGHGINLKNMQGNLSSARSIHVEGIIKNVNRTVKKAKKNTAVDISGNVIGKKPDIKLIGNKLLFITTLVCLVLVIVTVGISAAVVVYYKFNSENPVFSYNGAVEVVLQTNQTVATCFSVPRNVVPGLQIPQTVDVEYNQDLTQVLRLKAIYTTGDAENIVMELGFDEGVMVLSEDYYYLMQPIATGEKINLIHDLTIPVDYELSISSNNLNMITMIFETLPVDSSLVALLWAEAPQVWTSELFG